MNISVSTTQPKNRMSPDLESHLSFCLFYNSAEHNKNACVYSVPQKSRCMWECVSQFTVRVQVQSSLSTMLVVLPLAEESGCISVFWGS